MHIKNPLIPTFVLASFISINTDIVIGDTYVETLNEPDFDRWMYLYNGSPGYRSVAPSFGAVGHDDFDERDGQILLGFITSNNVPTDLGSSNYTIESASLDITLSSAGIIYDPSEDAWETYDPNSGINDLDEGRPMELFGASFRSGFDGWAFGENGPFPFGAGRSKRNAFPISFLPNGETVDVSNNVMEEFQPQIFGIGRNSSLKAGVAMPSETVLTFELNVSDENIQNYLQNSFDDGLVNLIITSMHAAEQPGLRHNGTTYPNFYMKENMAVVFDLVDAAQLTFVVTIDQGGEIPEDIDGDGNVGINDLLLLIAAWGQCDGCNEDINNDGYVNVQDILAVIGGWTD